MAPKATDVGRGHDVHGVGATGGEPKSFEASLDGPVEYRTYRRLMALFRRADALVFGGVLLLALVASLMEVVGVGAVPVLVAALAVPERLLEYPIAQRIVGLLGIETDRELVLWGSIGLLVVYVVKNSLLGVIYYVQTWVVERYRVGLADELFSAYMRAPLEFHLQRNSSELLRNVQLETREIVIGVIAPFMNVVMGGLMTVLIVALLAWTAPLTTLLAVGIVGGGSWAFVHLFKGRLHRLGLEAQKQRHVSVQAVLQGLGGLVPARLLGKEGFFLEEHRRSIKRAVRAIRTNSFINKLTGPVLELVAVVGVVSIVLLTLASGSDLPSIMPLLALFGAAIVRLRATVSQVVGGVNRIRFGIVAANPLYEDMLALGALGSGSEELALGTESPVERLPYDSELRLENVTYTYPGGNGPALKNVTAAISCGSSVAFVGATGSGKTTLLNVILGLLRPQEGSVTVDGRRVDEATAAWQRNLGYIPQSIFLLDDTLRRNVAFGTADAAIDEDALNEALEIAQLADFVASLADGLDTRVGEQGVRLSGGQRQRIGIARALYTRPAVLVLDEATSSLDNETEDLVMRALDHARRDRTVIMVAHRLSTVQGCDVLHYMSDGQIEASGTYESLLSGHPGFRQMVSTGSGA